MRQKIKKVFLFSLIVTTPLIAAPSKIGLPHDKEQPKPYEKEWEADAHSSREREAELFTEKEKKEETS
ncbi:MAG: hypothetical protein K2W97_09275 [Chthoniobacterales bacterium]|nr:hypothetical protein [Chthoniobacterales bacterium]